MLNGDAFYNTAIVDTDNRDTNYIEKRYYDICEYITKLHNFPKTFLDV